MGGLRTKRGSAVVAVLSLLLAACGGSGGGASSAPASFSAGPSAAPSGPTATPEVTASVSPGPALEGRLLFGRFIETTHSFTGMFVVQPDGSGETEVPLPFTEAGGRWSSAGSEIAVPTQLADGRISTAVLGVDGTVHRTLQIADPTLNLACTVWSSDDARLACFGWDEGTPDRGGIYSVLAADGSDLQRVTTPPAGMQDEPGDYSSTGQLIFKRFVGDEGPGPLMLLDAAGSDPRPLSDESVEDSGRFSPDGTAIATSAAGKILVFALDGTIRSTTELPQHFLFGPSWSPDGVYLAYSGDAGGYASDIFISRSDGTDLRQATTTPENEITVDWGVDPN